VTGTFFICVPLATTFVITHVPRMPKIKEPCAYLPERLINYTRYVYQSFDFFFSRLQSIAALHGTEVISYSKLCSCLYGTVYVYMVCTIMRARYIDWLIDFFTRVLYCGPFFYTSYTVRKVPQKRNAFSAEKKKEDYYSLISPDSADDFPLLAGRALTACNFRERPLAARAVQPGRKFGADRMQVYEALRDTHKNCSASTLPKNNNARHHLIAAYHHHRHRRGPPVITRRCF